MGASSWDHLGPPGEILWADDEFMGTIGTRSILDVYGPAEADAPRDGSNFVCPLKEDEPAAAFDCLRPTFVTFREAEEAGRLPDAAMRTGRCAAIYEGGEPDRVAIWGRSGG